MVYRGLVRDGVVVLETGVTFPEGTVVEVQAADPDAQVAILEQTCVGLPDYGRIEEMDRLIGVARVTTRAALRAESRLDGVL